MSEVEKPPAAPENSVREAGDQVSSQTRDVASPTPASQETGAASQIESSTFLERHSARESSEFGALRVSLDTWRMATSILAAAVLTLLVGFLDALGKTNAAVTAKAQAETDKGTAQSRAAEAESRAQALNAQKAELEKDLAAVRAMSPVLEYYGDRVWMLRTYRLGELGGPLTFVGDCPKGLCFALQIGPRTGSVQRISVSPTFTVTDFTMCLTSKVGPEGQTPIGMLLGGGGWQLDVPLDKGTSRGLWVNGEELTLVVRNPDITALTMDAVLAHATEKQACGGILAGAK